MNSIVARYRALPRVLKWIAWAACVLIGFVVIDRTLLRMQDRLNARADLHQSILDSYARGARARDDAEATIAGGIARFGLVEMPADASRRASEFNRAIDAVLERNGVRDQTSTTDNAGAAEQKLSERFGQGVRVARLVRHVQFDGSPRTVARVIADLERTPLVSGVSRVEITTATRRDEGRGSVRARLSVETLVIERKGRA